MDLNQLNITGRLGKDPDIRYATSGTAVANTSVAVSKTYKGEDQTLWLRVVAFGNLAETMGEHCSKGMKVFVSGELKENVWTDKEGVERRNPEIIAYKVIFLDRGKQPRERQDITPSPEDDPNGHIPF